MRLVVGCQTKKRGWYMTNVVGIVRKALFVLGFTSLPQCSMAQTAPQPDDDSFRNNASHISDLVTNDGDSSAPGNSNEPPSNPGLCFDPYCEETAITGPDNITYVICNCPGGVSAMGPIDDNQ